jgi:hypothetical protein
MPLPALIPVEKHIKDKTTLDAINTHVYRNIDSLRTQWRVLREQKITTWRKIYRGTPKEKFKSFPWKGAANLVPRIVSSFTDQLTARLIMGLYGTDPLFPAGLLGTFTPEDQAEEQRDAVEQFMSSEGKSPHGLNLFEAEYAWLHNGNKYGFSALKHGWEHLVEQVALTDSGDTVVFSDYVKYDGPRPLAVKFEDFMCPLNVSDFRQANFLIHVSRLTEFDLQDRKARKIYPAAKIDLLLAKPDRFGPDKAQKELEDEVSGAASTSEVQKEWDLYECWFPFIFAGKRYQIIATYHYETKTMMKLVFNFLPNNMIPYKLARMGVGESIVGMGFCELLGVYQEEIAQIHNQRRDSGTLANTTIIRADAASQLDTNFSVYPMAVLVGSDGQFSFETIGRATTETIKEEQMTLQLAQDAAGVGPSSAGSGAGSVNKKGSYSSMGTFATSQEGNTRANLHQTSSRFAHLTLGNDLLSLYAHFGISDKKIASMGKMGEHLKVALQNVREGRICIPIHAATGSINKEVEKQNKMLMLQHVRMTWQQIQQTLGMVANPMVPPEVLKYALETADAANILTSGLMRDFGFEDPSRMLPDPHSKEILDAKQKAQQQKQGPVPVANINPGATPDNVRQIAQQAGNP